MEQTARFLSAPDGPRIAMTEADGWDTHANQGATAGNLARRFAALDAGLATLRDGLGEHWDTTAVLVVTEFGRTVRVNGTGGTDHGTGGAALLLGGAVAGGKVTADWPGLNTLYEDRDLMPTTDLRSVFKAALVEHLGLDEARYSRKVATRPYCPICSKRKSVADVRDPAGARRGKEAQTEQSEVDEIDDAIPVEIRHRRGGEKRNAKQTQIQKVRDAVVIQIEVAGVADAVAV
jgi:hypothetical protein